jgi:hypothetical protein
MASPYEGMTLIFVAGNYFVQTKDMDTAELAKLPKMNITKQLALMFQEAAEANDRIRNDGDVPMVQSLHCFY